jgi:hypothetical protein
MRRHELPNINGDGGRKHYKRDPSAFGSTDIGNLEEILGVEGDFVGGGNPHMKFGWQVLDAAKNGDARTMKELLGPNLPVNVIDPDDRATALHYIATFGARPALRVIVKSRNLDYLLRDGEGRLPSELAREFGHDDAMARLLLIKETRQAKARSIDPTSLYKVSARRAGP